MAEDAPDVPALPWLAAPLGRALETQTAHALLLHAPGGVGQFELGLLLAQGWLCESTSVPLGERPCGPCASCRLVAAHSHPDLLVLVPEALREGLGWAAADAEEGGEDKAGKKKPSKEIRVDEVRAAIALALTTSSRGRGKVIVIHPAERMNAIAANAFLKTLEEPAGEARFVLCTAAPDGLLPTIRSRCQAIALGCRRPRSPRPGCGRRASPSPRCCSPAAAASRRMRWPWRSSASMRPLGGAFPRRRRGRRLGAARLAGAARGRCVAEALPRRRQRRRRRGAALLRRRSLPAAPPHWAGCCAGLASCAASPSSPSTPGTPTWCSRAWSNRDGKRCKRRDRGRAAARRLATLAR